MPGRKPHIEQGQTVKELLEYAKVSATWCGAALCIKEGDHDCKTMSRRNTTDKTSGGMGAP